MIIMVLPGSRGSRIEAASRCPASHELDHTFEDFDIPRDHLGPLG